MTMSGPDPQKVDGGFDQEADSRITGSRFSNTSGSSLRQVASRSSWRIHSASVTDVNERGEIVVELLV